MRQNLSKQHKQQTADFSRLTENVSPARSVFSKIARRVHEKARHSFKRRSDRTTSGVERVSGSGKCAGQFSVGTSANLGPGGHCVRARAIVSSFKRAIIHKQAHENKKRTLNCKTRSFSFAAVAAARSSSKRKNNIFCACQLLILICLSSIFFKSTFFSSSCCLKQ